MRKILLLLLCTPLFVKAQTGDKNFIYQNYIEVTGKSEMEIAPDLIYIKGISKNSTPHSLLEKGKGLRL